MADRTLQGGLGYHLVNLAAAALVLAGVFMCVRGAVGGITQIGAVYSGVSGTTREVINGPEVSEEERVKRMGDNVRSMGWGAVPLAVGSLILIANQAICRRKRKRLAIDQAGLTL